LETLAADAAGNPQRKRSCILLWMSGGPAQTDTFDMKPGHANGGPYKERETSAPGLRWTENLPKLAEFGDRCAVIRSMSTKPGHPTYDQSLKVRDLVAAEGVGREQQDARIGLLQDLDKDFAAGRPGATPRSHQLAYERAVKLMRTEAAKAFNLEEEKDAVRDA